VSNDGAGVELQELIKMVNIEIVNALRDILQFIEEEVILPDVERFNRKTQAINKIKKRYPWLKQPITYKKRNSSSCSRDN